MQTVKLTWQRGGDPKSGEPRKSSGPVATGETVEFVFDAPNPVPAGARNGLVGIGQKLSAAEGFSAIFQGTKKSGGQSNGVSFTFNHFPPVPGRNTVVVTANADLAGLTGELKVGTWPK